MASTCRVTAPMVGLKVRDLNGAWVVMSFNAGAVVSNVELASLEHHLAKGMVELVDDPQPEPDSQPEPGPADGKVKDILTEVGDDKDKAAAALEAEQAKGDAARPTLVEALQAVLNT